MCPKVFFIKDGDSGRGRGRGRQAVIPKHTTVPQYEDNFMILSYEKILIFC